ncbi:hypothetical protein WMY93_024727 [Mugilogobius chulae]|uniref:Uncharacterized protein n=1 Tax=Mugilogobius chulae TaxID=88201 RepID=A0AAW0NBF7_9GOBI
MCEKVDYVRALVSERLTAAAEEIFALVVRTIVEYEEELCRSKEENQRKQQLLDSLLNPQLRIYRTEVGRAEVCVKTEPQELSIGLSLTFHLLKSSQSKTKPP